MKGDKMNTLSPKQRETLRVIRASRSRTGLPPTQRELVKLLGVTQNAVRMRLASLARKGYVVLVPHLARGIVLVERSA
jgi:DNA-binding MarR family transcriptional regulator